MITAVNGMPAFSGSIKKISQNVAGQPGKTPKTFNTANNVHGNLKQASLSEMATTIKKTNFKKAGAKMKEIFQKLFGHAQKTTPEKPKTEIQKELDKILEKIRNGGIKPWNNKPAFPIKF